VCVYTERERGNRVVVIVDVKEESRRKDHHEKISRVSEWTFLSFFVEREKEKDMKSMRERLSDEILMWDSSTR